MSRRSPEFSKTWLMSVDEFFDSQPVKSRMSRSLYMSKEDFDDFLNKVKKFFKENDAHFLIQALAVGEDAIQEKFSDHKQLGAICNAIEHFLNSKKIQSHYRDEPESVAFGMFAGKIADEILSYADSKDALEKRVLSEVKAGNITHDLEYEAQLEQNDATNKKKINKKTNKKTSKKTAKPTTKRKVAKTPPPRKPEKKPGPVSENTNNRKNKLPIYYKDTIDQQIAKLPGKIEVISYRGSITDKRFATLMDEGKLISLTPVVNNIFCTKPVSGKRALNLFMSIKMIFAQQVLALKRSDLEKITINKEDQKTVDEFITGMNKILNCSKKFNMGCFLNEREAIGWKEGSNNSETFPSNPIEAAKLTKALVERRIAGDISGMIIG